MNPGEPLPDGFYNPKLFEIAQQSPYRYETVKEVFDLVEGTPTGTQLSVTREIIDSCAKLGLNPVAVIKATMEAKERLGK